MDKGHGRRTLSALQWTALVASVLAFFFFAEEIWELIRQVRTKPVAASRVFRLGGLDKTRHDPDHDETIKATLKLGTHGRRRGGGEGGGLRGGGRGGGKRGVELKISPITTDSHETLTTSALREELKALREAHEETKSKHSQTLVELETLRAELASISDDASKGGPKGESEPRNGEEGRKRKVKNRSRIHRRWPNVDADVDEWPGWEPVPSPSRVFGRDFPAEPSKGGACSGTCTSPDGAVAAHLGGDAEDVDELKRAAAARSHLGEIIVFGTTADDLYAQYAHALVLNLEKLSLRHHMAITTNETHCANLKKAMAETEAGKSSGCVWSSYLDHSKIDYEDGRKAEFEEYKQWSVVSKLVHLGYNVLVVDTDIRLLVNPYPFFKDPAIFGNHNLITQAETYGHYPFNVGVLYVQNATAGVSQGGPGGGLWDASIPFHSKFHTKAASLSFKTPSLSSVASLSCYQRPRLCKPRYGNISE